MKQVYNYTDKFRYMRGSMETR